MSHLQQHQQFVVVDTACDAQVILASSFTAQFCRFLITNLQNLYLRTNELTVKGDLSKEERPSLSFCQFGKDTLRT